MKSSIRRPAGDPTLGAISISCPWCGSTIQASLAGLRVAQAVACEACGTAVELDRLHADRPGRTFARAA